jgi:4'-phosphopantetheinyl transferase
MPCVAFPTIASHSGNMATEMETVWAPPSGTLTLPKNEVHIWRAWLEADAAELLRWREFLSEDEVSRADRFVFPRDRDHFIVARGRLREILGMYLGRSPESLRFQTGKYGKPALGDQSDLRFNLTHSHGLAVYGFAMERALGIDVEKIRPDFGGEEIAERYFSAAEQKELRELPVELRATAFFLCWTRKEAYIKAHGDGLQMPLASFDVSLTPDKPATLRSSDGQRWSLCSFTPAPGYAAAMIAEGQAPSIRYLEG